METSVADRGWMWLKYNPQTERVITSVLEKFLGGIFKATSWGKKWCRGEDSQGLLIRHLKSTSYRHCYKTLCTTHWHWSMKRTIHGPLEVHHLTLSALPETAHANRARSPHNHLLEQKRGQYGFYPASTDGLTPLNRVILLKSDPIKKLKNTQPPGQTSQRKWRPVCPYAPLRAKRSKHHDEFCRETSSRIYLYAHCSSSLHPLHRSRFIQIASGIASQPHSPSRARNG